MSLKTRNWKLEGKWRHGTALRSFQELRSVIDRLSYDVFDLAKQAEALSLDAHDALVATYLLVSTF